MLTAVRDGFRNIVANLGTDRDKAAHHGYALPLQSPQDQLVVYRASALARRVVDMPAQDACREWRAWQADEADIGAIEAEERRLDVQGQTLRAIRRARLYGGSAIYIGTGEADPRQPLVPERIGRGGLLHLNVLSMADLSGVEIETDARLLGFGAPRMWRLRDGVEVHPSRLCLFRGAEVEVDHVGTPADWGDSVLVAALEAVSRVDAGAAAVASLIMEAKVDVLGIAGFTSELATGGEAYERQVLTRMNLVARAKGINGMFVKDADDTYEQKSASFGGLPEVMDRFMILASAASGIPVTLLFGRSAAGMNATGEGDANAYYERISAFQNLAIEPSQSILTECLIRSALGDRPDDVHFNWRPLAQPDPKERAEIGEKIANTFKALRECTELPQEAIDKAAVNALTEAGAAPGLEAAYEEFYSAAPDGDEADLTNVVPLRAVADAAPRTLYVSRKVLNGAEIIRWAKAQGFASTLSAADLHVTITFSREPVDWMAMGQSWDETVKVPPGGPRLMERFGDARVLLFRADDLEWRHRRMIEEGATWDHPEYQPHITISYDPDAPDLATVEPYQGPIVLGPETFAEVDADWAEKVEETEA